MRGREFGHGFEGRVARTRVVEWLTGPQFTARSDVADVFVHTLFGIADGEAGADFAGFSDRKPAFGGWGGVDVRLTRRLALSAQFDWLGSFADIVRGRPRAGSRRRAVRAAGRESVAAAVAFSRPGPLV